jgi:glycosyltransferase involved in cell wall biosynthesis
MKKEAKLQKGYSNKNSFNFWFVDFVIAISEAVKIGLINNYEIKNITVIHNGIDVDTYPPSKRTESMRYRIYFMARNVKWKRADWFVRAAKKIHDIYPQTKFGIFGCGPEDENIRKLIKEMDSQNYIRMYGFIDRYNDRLDEYGIYVISSYMEPFGKTVLEALFMNKVVVGTNAGGIPEILPDYKLLFERDSFEDFVLKLKNAILNYDYYYNQINEIRVRYKNYYSMKRVGREYNKAYKLLPK